MGDLDSEKEGDTRGSVSESSLYIQFRQQLPGLAEVSAAWTYSEEGAPGSKQGPAGMDGTEGRLPEDQCGWSSSKTEFQRSMGYNMS